MDLRGMIQIMVSRRSSVDGFVLVGNTNGINIEKIILSLGEE